MSQCAICSKDVSAHHYVRTKAMVEAGESRGRKFFSSSPNDEHHFYGFYHPSHLCQVCQVIDADHCRGHAIEQIEQAIRETTPPSNAVPVSMLYNPPKGLVIGPTPGVRINGPVSVIPLDGRVRRSPDGLRVAVTTAQTSLRLLLLSLVGLAGPQMMAAFGYTQAKGKILKAEIDFNAPDDIRILLVMTNTTADTEEDIEFIGGLTTLDEFDGANYARKALASEAVNIDTTNNRAEFDAADLTAGGTGWTGLGAGTRSIQAIVGYKHVTNDADSPLLWYDDSAAQLPFNGNGSDVGITWNAEGILQL